MQKKLKGFYLVISSLFIAALHLPFAFAKSATSGRSSFQTAIQDSGKAVSMATISSARSVYDSLQSKLQGLSREAFTYASQGFDKLVAQGKILNNSIISIVDFSQPSSSKRLYIIDLKNYKVLFNTWVAHGRNSGREMASSFSNRESSYMSSPGFYITSDTYRGKHGYSLKLEGVEKGINDKAYERAIVMHGAAYVNPSLISSQGYIGRSLGCPAVPEQMATPIINTIKDGTCLFIYHPGQSYIQQSALLS
jgi:hypothetical protein